jgi:hypothetical protein
MGHQKSRKAQNITFLRSVFVVTKLDHQYNIDAKKNNSDMFSQVEESEYWNKNQRGKAFLDVQQKILK